MNKKLIFRAIFPTFCILVFMFGLQALYGENFSVFSYVMGFVAGVISVYIPFYEVIKKEYAVKPKEFIHMVIGGRFVEVPKGFVTYDTIIRLGGYIMNVPYDITVQYPNGGIEQLLKGGSFYAYDNVVVDVSRKESVKHGKS